MSSAASRIEQAEVDLHRGLELYEAARFVDDDEAAADASALIAEARSRLGALQSSSPSVAARLRQVRHRIGQRPSTPAQEATPTGPAKSATATEGTSVAKPR